MAKDNKALIIGLGLIAVGAIAYFVFKEEEPTPPPPPPEKLNIVGLGVQSA